MCGRYELNETPANLGSRYRVEPGDLDFARNADVRPTQTNPVILLCEGQRVASMRKWGIVPFWAKDPKAISTPFNARTEEAYAKPMFRGPFKSKRCLVPASAFFEWKAIEGQKKKQKYRIARADGDLVTLAGLYDRWHHGDELIESYTILTTAPNTLMETIHNRMPVILGPADEDEWLDPATSVDIARAMCISCPSDWLTPFNSFCNNSTARLHRRSDPRRCRCP
jgi:putative SOS response-associated peptidase YedK